MQMLRLPGFEMPELLRIQSSQNRRAFGSVAQVSVEGVDKILNRFVDSLMKGTQKSIDLFAIRRSKVREIFRGWHRFLRCGLFHCYSSMRSWYLCRSKGIRLCLRYQFVLRLQPKIILVAFT